MTITKYSIKELETTLSVIDKLIENRQEVGSDILNLDSLLHNRIWVLTILENLKEDKSKNFNYYN